MVFNHGMIVSLVLLFGVAVSAVAAEPGITVEARQRYPWNGLVDLKFTITGESGTKYDTSFVAKDMVGGTNIAMKTIRKSNGVVAEEKEKLLPGIYNWVWDAAADLPDGFKCERMTVMGSAEDTLKLYMVLDLKTGAVSYFDAIPNGAWSDTYKKTHVAMRLCQPGTFLMQGKRKVTLTKPFYIGVFEMTEKHIWNITGWFYDGNYDYADNSLESHAKMKPCGNISYNTLRGSSNGAKWPSKNSVDSGSIIGKIRSKTGMAFDVPTEAQWEYACRAGTTSKYNNGSSSDENLSSIAHYGLITSTHDTDTVGKRQPNGWGIYDMHGNAKEWVLDWYGDIGVDDAIDPKGPTSGSQRTCRGGAFDSSASSCTSNSRISLPANRGTYMYPDYTSDDHGLGFRLCLTVE